MRGSTGIGLKLVLGPANSGKMGHVLEWWRERLPLHPVVVAPTLPDAQELSVEMVRRAGAVVGQSCALTLDGLVRLLLGRAPRFVTDLERSLIVSRLLGETPLQTLGSTVHLPGLARTLGTLLLQLGESGKTHEEVRAVLAGWASADPGAAPLAGDIGRLAAGYAREREGLGLGERSAATRKATRSVTGWSRPVALYGFTSFTPGQRDLLVALAERTEVLLTFNHERTRAVNLTAAEEVSWWEAMAAEVVDLAPRMRAYSSAAVAFLERYFLCDPPRPVPPPPASGVEGVRFLLASGQRNEAELAAQHVADLIRQGFPPGEIAVVVRRVRAWSALLGNVFASCGIPYQVDDRPTLAETGIGYAFLGVLKGIALDDAEGLLSYLRGPYSGLALQEVSDLELRYRRGTARGARALAEIAACMSLGSVERLWGLRSARPGTPELELAQARELSRSMLSAGVRGLAAGSREIEDDARAFRALENAFGALAGLAAADPEHRWLEIPLVLRSLACVTVPGGRMESGEAVQILSVQRARARRFSVVMILGLVEGEFPGRPGAPSLLTSRQRARLDSAGRGLFAPEPDQEGALLVSAVSRAWQLVYLSARDADDGGGEAMPSHFWYAAKELLGVREHEHEGRTLADQVFAPEEAPSLRHYLRACAAGGYVPYPASGADLRQISPYPWPHPPSRLSVPAVLAELSAATSFSPSALEAYLGCPFVWFMNRAIGVEEVEQELDGRVVGQLLHDALSATYRRLAALGALPLRPEGIPEAERVAFSIIEELVQSDECPGTVAERRLTMWRLRKMTRNLFQMEAQAGGPLSMSATELWVGGREGIDIGGLCIRGRIDRVDAACDGRELFVLDYKSGAIPAASAIGQEDGLQLPLYMLALAGERPENTVVGGAYLAPAAKKRSGVVLSGSEAVLGLATDGVRVLDEMGVRELLQSARDLACEAAEGMRAGIIAPRADRRCPSWCTLGSACRARRGGYGS